MEFCKLTGVAAALGAALAVSGCATLGIGPDASKRARTADAQSRREATHYLAERGVTAAHRIAEATATQQAARNAMPPSKRRVETGPAPRRRTVKRGDSATPPAQLDDTGSKTADGETADSQPAARRADGQSTSEGKTRQIERVPSDETIAKGSGAGHSDAHASVDPRVDSARIDLSTSAGRKKLANRFDIDAPGADENAVALTGTFHKDEDVADDQVAVVLPGRRVTFYAGGRTLASLEFGSGADLPDKLADVDAVRTVRDGTLQVLCYWAEDAADAADAGDNSGDAAAERIKVGIFKIFGEHVGRVFERTVAVKDPQDGSMTRRGYFEFLRGDKHHYIRWTPADEKGQPLRSKARVLHWNKWEGVYRVPKPPPTAPDNRS